MPLFDGLTPETILERILSRMETDLQTREGSYAYDQAAPAAFEIWRVMMTLGELVDAFYVNENSGPYLDQHARLFAMDRRSGTIAAAKMTFYGQDGVAIPAGSAFYTDGGLEFRLTADAVIENGSAQGRAEAAAVGSRYNVPAGAVTQALRSIPGVERFESSAADGGTDPETDAALFARIDERRKRPATSGNEDHYRQWALSVDGVGAVRVTRLWAGPGTVRVLIAGYDRRPVGQAVVDACAQYIETQRPVGAQVTVATAVAVPVDVSAWITLAPGGDLTSVQEALESKLDDYLRQLAFTQFTVYAARVGALIMSVDGVLDYGGLTLNGSGENLALGADAVPVPGEVSLT